MPLLSPSILAADFACLLEEILKVEKAGADMLHIDVMDGHFVPNLSFGIPVIQSIVGKTSLPFDVHLMVDNPDAYVNELARLGVYNITVHAESCIHMDRLLNRIKSAGIKASVALNPSTPLTVLDYTLALCDMVLIMTVNPGFGGQKLIPYTLEKVRDLKVLKEKRGLEFLIQVDGGIDIQNVRKVIDAGADVIVAGTCVFKSENVEKTVYMLKGGV
ncbi:ribulose-phosphate 3-epimerase [Caldanaerobius polysaccharolyticus]|uniref:ribulose-phosphate 3-epimerase n=1 Tax=Caldanaerobius polysaccharolyticus TaxID=44256 RepID=UPI00047A3026|nr:ribulose-phosphate 3-epimerase [Caldanaerobius polysaccharolyticus]